MKWDDVERQRDTLLSVAERAGDRGLLTSVVPSLRRHKGRPSAPAPEGGVPSLVGVPGYIQQAAIARAFAALDRDQDGLIRAGEIPTALSGLQWAFALHDFERWLRERGLAAQDRVTLNDTVAAAKFVTHQDGRYSPLASCPLPLGGGSAAWNASLPAPSAPVLAGGSLDSLARSQESQSLPRKPQSVAYDLLRERARAVDGVDYASLPEAADVVRAVQLCVSVCLHASAALREWYRCSLTATGPWWRDSD